MADVQAEQQLIDRAQQKLEKRKRFEAVFPMLVDEIMAYCTSEGSELVATCGGPRLTEGV